MLENKCKDLKNDIDNTALLCSNAVKESQEILMRKLSRKMDQRMESVRGYHPETFGEKVTGEVQIPKEDLQDFPQL